MSPKPGWYPDPLNPEQMRFWDGQNWSEQAKPLPAPNENPVDLDPPTAASSVPQPPVPQPPVPQPPESSVPQPPAPQPPASSVPQPPMPQTPAPQPPDPTAGQTVPQPPAPQPPMPQAPAPQASTKTLGSDKGVLVLVLSVVSLFFCLPLAIVPLVMTSKIRRQGKESGQPVDGMITAGWILSIIALVIFAVVFLAFLAGLMSTPN